MNLPSVNSHWSQLNTSYIGQSQHEEPGRDTVPVEDNNGPPRPSALLHLDLRQDFPRLSTTVFGNANPQYMRITRTRSNGQVRGRVYTLSKFIQ